MSADQLSLATDRCAWTVRGDATRLPFADGSVPRAVVTLVHTDVDDYAPVLREVARVVVPGGEVVHLGVHPCFVGHHIEAPDRSEERLAVGPATATAAGCSNTRTSGPACGPASAHATCRWPSC